LSGASKNSKETDQKTVTEKAKEKVDKAIALDEEDYEDPTLVRRTYQEREYELK
jgi:hypothetical protein